MSSDDDHGRVDGDCKMQVDTALDTFVVQAKWAERSVVRRAKLPIFPDLNTGNIAAKMAQVIVGVPACGQMLKAGMRRGRDLAQRLGPRHPRHLSMPLPSRSGFR